jgi:iron complex outermembrane recepter protein
MSGALILNFAGEKNFMAKQNKSLLKWGVSLGLLSLAIAQAANAAPEEWAVAQADKKRAESQGVSDEIIVTAQRRSERLEDVPLSITAVSQEFLVRSGLRSAADLKFAAPGLDITSSTGSIMLTMRGTGVQFVSPGLEPPVAIYVDNVYIPRTNGLNSLLDLVDSDSVEVIRGPQGTLYGRNATGGVIRINSANPSDEFEGRVAAEYGRFDNGQLDAMLNVPVSDDFGVRFAGRRHKSDGYVKNADGKTLPAIDNYTARMRMRWTPSDTLEIVGGIERIHSKANGYNDLLGDGGPTCYVCGVTGTQPGSFYRSNVTIAAPYENRATRGDLRINLERGDYTLSSTTTYFKNRSEQNADNDFTPVDIFRFNVNRNGGKTFGQELQLAFAGDGPLSYIAALSYLHDKSFIDFSLEGAAFQFSQTFVGVFPRNNNSVETDSYSGLLEAVYEFSDTVKLTVGGRYTSDKRKQSVNNNAGFQLFGAPAGFGDSDTFKAFTPRVVLAWDNGPTNVYYSYTRGFKAGGFVSPSPFPGRAVKSEKIFSHEIGIKHSAFDDRVTAGLSTFYFKNKDLQQQIIDINSGGTITENAGASEGYGVELELNARPVDSLSLGVSVGYLHAEYDKYEDAAVVCFDPTGTSNVVNPGATLYPCRADLSGTDVPHAPELTLSGNASYTFPIGAWSGSLSGLVQYRSKSLFWPGAGGELGYDRQKGYTVANFSGYVSPPGDKLRVGFYLDNAFDEKYATIRTTLQPWGLAYNAAPPRTYGARVEYNF